jgi:hypothetical protein
MRLSYPDAAQEDDIGRIGDKLRPEEVFDLQAVYFLGLLQLN